MRTVFDPAKILGCSLEEAQCLLRGRPVTPGEVEGVALQHYNWRAHLHDPGSYWVTLSQAAELLHCSTRELSRLLGQRRLPFQVHRSGVRLMRRQDVEAFAARHGVPDAPRDSGASGHRVLRRR